VLLLVLLLLVLVLLVLVLRLVLLLLLALLWLELSMLLLLLLLLLLALLLMWYCLPGGACIQDRLLPVGCCPCCRCCNCCCALICSWCCCCCCWCRNCWRQGTITGRLCSVNSLGQKLGWAATHMVTCASLQRSFRLSPQPLALGLLLL
jgi:hypothetical protein